jgi:hypothetical protein
VQDRADVVAPIEHAERRARRDLDLAISTGHSSTG